MITIITIATAPTEIQIRALPTPPDDGLPEVLAPGLPEVMASGLVGVRGVGTGPPGITDGKSRDVRSLVVVVVGDREGGEGMGVWSVVLTVLVGDSISTVVSLLNSAPITMSGRPSGSP